MREQPASSSARVGQEDGVRVMSDHTQEELVEDARIDGVYERSRFGSFVRGVLVGGVLCGIGAVTASLLAPLPSHLPGVGNVEIVGAEPEQANNTETEPEQSASTDKEEEQERTAPLGKEPAAQEEQAEASVPQDEGAASASSESAESGENQTQTVATTDQSSEQDTQQAVDQNTQQPADQATQQSAEQDTQQSTEQGNVSATVESSEVAQSAPQEAEPTTTDLSDSQTDTSEVAALTQPDTSVDQEPASQETTTGEVASADPDEASSTAEVTPPPAAEPALDGPALEVNARAFNAPEGAPLLAVVLADAGNGEVPEEALTLMTMPLTLAIRPDGAPARELADKARGAGHEILAQLPVSREAEGEAQVEGDLSTLVPEDQLQVLTNRYLAEFEMAVGVTAPEGARLLTNQRAMEAVLGPVTTHGFAYLDLKAGIGSTARRIAGETGLAYVQSNRYVAAGATLDQVYQMLEGASFQARRQGSAVVSISASPAALTALVKWGLERGGKEVWLAPLSAVIARQQAE